MRHMHAVYSNKFYKQSITVIIMKLLIVILNQRISYMKLKMKILTSKLLILVYLKFAIRKTQAKLRDVKPKLVLLIIYLQKS